MCAQNGVIVGNQQLAYSVDTFVFGHKTTTVSHRQLDHTARDAFPLQRLFRLAHAGYLGIRIYHTGDGTVAHRIFSAGNVVDCYLGFAHGSMCQQRETCQVATDVYTRQGCLHVFVHHDATPFGLLQFQIFQSETFRHRTTAHTHQQPLSHN